jgi:glycine/D-amino acid oxidase-like deaminating enzyme
MDLKSGYPYWAVKNGLMQAFPQLEQDRRCDVVVIGGGITGALIANELATHGFDVVVLEQRDVGWGSSAASTALLQYEIDTHMIDLARKYGEADAALAYLACADAIDRLGEVAAPWRDVEFARNRSLYYASRRRHTRELKEEGALRARQGLQVEFLERDALRGQYGLDAPAALLSRQAARVDPYRLAHRLLQRLQRAGAGVFDRTRVEDIQATSRGVTLRTAQGQTVRAGHLVMAAGYASQHWLKKKVARNRSSYAFISDPMAADAMGFLEDTLLWESARPYLYVRSTGDRRLLVGGEDDAVDIPARRDARVGKKAATLLKKLHALFPNLAVTPAFSWAGTFAETDDGLPFFGPHPQWGPRVHFAMAYGGNGITYSMLGAGLLRALMERRKHALWPLFSFQRLER